MARSIPPQFTPVSGADNRTKGYIDTATGEYLSRRQFDKKYGVLFDQGFTSYEQRQKTAKPHSTKVYRYAKTIHSEHVLDINGDIWKQVDFLTKFNPNAYAWYLKFTYENELGATMSFSLSATDDISDAKKQFRKEFNKYVDETWFLVSVAIEFIGEI